MKDRFEKIEQRFRNVRRSCLSGAIRDNNDKTGLHLITGEVVDANKHVKRNGRDIDSDVRAEGRVPARANARMSATTSEGHPGRRPDGPSEIHIKGGSRQRAPTG